MATLVHKEVCHKAMDKQPILKTDRLTLRPFDLSDARQVQALAGDRRVSEMTVNIPHPYEDGLAEQWISRHPENFAARRAVAFAVTLSESGDLIGTVSLTQLTRDDGNLGYWIGLPYWNRGYCTEAVKALTHFGFKYLELPQIYARHLSHNVASGRVILKNGFRHIGRITAEINGRTRSLEHYELYPASRRMLR
jgi:ribosomal-protein-alanine N-acetyltransferase